MGIYFLSDLATTFSGDLELDSKGDLKLGDPIETQKSITNFWLRTDQGEYVPNPSIGCNLGSFIGAANSPRTLEQIENQTHATLIRNIWYPEDLAIKVVPLDREEVMIALQLKGEFFDVDGVAIPLSPIVIAYSFPYITADVSPLIQ
jgi:hypothetical protein